MGTKRGKNHMEWKVSVNGFSLNFSFIDFSLIVSRILICLVFFEQTLAVLNPFRTTDQDICQDTDMAGPLVFCLALGGFLLLVSIAIQLLTPIKTHYKQGQKLINYLWTSLWRVAKLRSPIFTGSEWLAASHSTASCRWWPHRLKSHSVQLHLSWATACCRWSSFPGLMFSLPYSEYLYTYKNILGLMMSFLRQRIVIRSLSNFQCKAFQQQFLSYPFFH